MNLFNSPQEASDYITTQLDKIGKLARLAHDDYSAVADIMASLAAGVCEAIVYLCCSEDSDPNGAIPFPKLKDFPKYSRNFGPMNIPEEVARAAKEIAKAEKVDIFNPINDFADRIIDEIVHVFLPWIIDNARCMPARDFAEDLRNLLRDFSSNFLGEY